MESETLMGFAKTADVLRRFADEFQTEYKAALLQSDRRASNKLLDSIKMEVTIGDKSFSVTMSLEDYWKYVEWDTKPHFPPVSAILKWVEVKPVVPRPDKNGRIPTQRQLAYLIARKIGEVGTKGSHDLENTLPAVYERFRIELESALAQDVGNYVVKVWGE